MSDLDDAIREHLELKRLHGADPSEVARLEQEALGEVARESVRSLADERRGHLRLAEDTARHEDELPRREDVVLLREEIVPPTNEYAQAHAGAYHEAGEETQEYSVVDEQMGWVGGPAWQGGAA
jgi:hypothetical protein